jgi:hypothetical protein
VAAAAAAGITPASLPFVLQRQEQGAGAASGNTSDSLETLADIEMEPAAAAASGQPHKRCHLDISSCPTAAVPTAGSAEGRAFAPHQPHLSHLPSGWTTNSTGHGSRANSSSSVMQGITRLGLQGLVGLSDQGTAGFISSDCQKLLQRLLMPPPPKRPRSSLGAAARTAAAAAAGSGTAAAGGAGGVRAGGGADPGSAAVPVSAVGSSAGPRFRVGLGRSSSLPAGVCIEGGSRTLLMSDS